MPSGFPGIPKKISVRNPRDDHDRSFLKFHIKKCSKFSLTGELKMPKKSQQLISGQLWTTKDAKEIPQSFLSMTEIPRHRFPWGFYPGSPMQQERPRIFLDIPWLPPKNQWDGMGNILGILFLMDFIWYSPCIHGYTYPCIKTEDPIFTIAWVYRA